MVRQSNVLYSLERKTAGVTAHYDPVQHMTLLVRRHVYGLNQIVVVQQSLQLVNIAIEKVFKLNVKITKKHKRSLRATVFRNQRWEFLIFSSFFLLLFFIFCVAVCFACWEGDDINKSPRLMCYHEITAVPLT